MAEKTAEMLNGTVHGDSLRPVILSGALMQVSYRTVCVSVCQRLIPRRYHGPEFDARHSAGRMNHARSGVVARSRVRRSALSCPYEPRAVRCGITVQSSTLGTQLAVRASLGPPAVIDRHRHRRLQRGTAQQATHLSGHDHGHVCRFEIVGHLNIRETIKARHFKFSTQIGHMKC